MPKTLVTLRFGGRDHHGCFKTRTAGHPIFLLSRKRNCQRKEQDHPLTIVTSQTFSLFDRYSKLIKLIRVTCTSYVLRFSNNTRRVNEKKLQTYSTNSKSKISMSKKNRAILGLVRIIQSKYFKEEIHSLTKHHSIKKCSPILRLSPFLDENRILRIGGRLEATNLPYTAKHPILLPGHHPFSHLIVKHEHKRHLHVGAQATLAAIRQNYWITSARNIVRQIVKMHN